MIVSWNWLKDYVPLDMSPEELAHRLAMAGLNHEWTKAVDDDWAIDLEVTSNRPDCLGHIGIAREIAVLWKLPLEIESPEPTPSGRAVAQLTKVSVRCPQLCPRYSARVIRGVKIGPSPDWLVRRLKTLGIATINNVVDVTNYVLMENGQPLHAFDFGRLAGPEIIVREATAGELFVAIDHKTYTLETGMCVIADARRAIALGGVMGGADSEVSDSTTDLLIEAADFAQLSIRATARKLNLHSPSSYRFERGVDPEGVDWASRRCCELILELAGGELAEGVIDVRAESEPREPIDLRFAQLQRILGIDVPRGEARRILAALGLRNVRGDDSRIEVVPPTWRRDLTREIDLIEEVGRIHGYEQIPEDVGVPMAPSHKRNEDRVIDMVRRVMTASGFDEAMTASVVREDWDSVFSPWSEAESLRASTPMLKGADRLRRSLIPSLLDARRINESLSNDVIELFETARVYLPNRRGLPREQWTLALTSGDDYSDVKGVVESLVAAIAPHATMEVAETKQQLLDESRSAMLRLNGESFGFLGEVSAAGLKQLGLRAKTTIAEISIDVLVGVAELTREFSELSPYPSIARDLNLVVDESLQWSDLANTVRQAVGDSLEQLSYQETYRDPQKDGAGKKRLLFTITLRSAERTMTNEEADAIRERVVAACEQEYQAKLLA